MWNFNIVIIFLIHVCKVASNFPFSHLVVVQNFQNHFRLFNHDSAIWSILISNLNEKFVLALWSAALVGIEIFISWAFLANLFLFLSRRSFFFHVSIIRWTFFPLTGRSSIQNKMIFLQGFLHKISLNSMQNG